MMGSHIVTVASTRGTDGFFDFFADDFFADDFFADDFFDDDFFDDDFFCGDFFANDFADFFDGFFFIMHSRGRAV